MNAMLEPSDKKDTFKHRKKRKERKKPYMSSMQGSSITHLFKNNESVCNEYIVFFCCSTQKNKA